MYWFYYSHTPRGQCFSKPQCHPWQSHLHPTLPPCWKHYLFLGRRSPPLRQDVGATGWNVFPGSQPLLSITVRPSLSSSRMHPDLCVASSIPFVSSDVNCQKISSTTHTYAPVLRMLHLWFIPSEVSMFAGEMNQPNVGWDYGERWSGLPRISKCEWGWEVLEYDASMVPRTCDLDALDKDRFPWDVFRGCEWNATQGMVVLLGQRERTHRINPIPSNHGIALTPRSLLRISTLVHPLASSGSE